MDAHASIPDHELEARILELSHDFGNVWKATETTNEDRKRLLGWLVEDITLTRNSYQVELGLRLRGGRIHQLDPVELLRPRAALIRRDASPEILTELESLLEQGYPDWTAAEELNRRGHRDSRGDPFTRRSIYLIRTRNNVRNGIRRKQDQLRGQGCISGAELAEELGVPYLHLYKHVPGHQHVEIYEIPTSKRILKMYKLIPDSHNQQTS